MLATKFLFETLEKLVIDGNQFSSQMRESESAFSRNYQNLISDFGIIPSLLQKREPDFFVAIPARLNRERSEIQKKYTIASVDGSQIVSDDLEVNVAPFVLINIGRIQTNYPKKEVVNFDNFQHMITEAQRIDMSKEVSTYRTRSEFEIAKNTIENMKEENILLIDGGLLQWHLTDNTNELKEEVLSLVSRTIQTADQMRVHVLGYISGTNASDVVGSLRIMQCSDDTMSCLGCDNQFCYLSSRITDATLFTQILPGQSRLSDWQVSPIFKSTAPMIQKYYEQDIYFFYLYNQHEFARVECTGLTLENLSFVIGVLLDQLQKGFGYPLLLQEAHELAVLGNKDKLMIEQYIISQNKTQVNLTHRRMKNLSKKVKYI